MAWWKTNATGTRKYLHPDYFDGGRYGGHGWGDGFEGNCHGGGGAGRFGGNGYGEGRVDYLDD